MTSCSIRGRRARASCRADAGRTAGFTLLEVLVALAVLGVALVAAVEGIAATTRGAVAVRRSLAAVALAEARLEELALLPADSLAGYARLQRGRFAPPFGEFGWRALATRDSADATLLRAAVLVEWPAGEYTLETVFYRPELAAELRQAR